MRNSVLPSFHQLNCGGGSPFTLILHTVIRFTLKCCNAVACHVFETSSDLKVPLKDCSHLDWLWASCPLVYSGGQVLVPRQVGFCLVGRPRLSSLVHCNNPELVPAKRHCSLTLSLFTFSRHQKRNLILPIEDDYIPFSLTESRNPGLQLLNGGGTVVVVRDESVKPASKLVLLL